MGSMTLDLGLGSAILLSGKKLCRKKQEATLLRWFKFWDGKRQHLPLKLHLPFLWVRIGEVEKTGK